MIIGATQIKTTMVTGGTNIWVPIHPNPSEQLQKMRERMLRAKLIQPPMTRKSVAPLLQSSLKLCPMPIMIKAMTSRTIIWSSPFGAVHLEQSEAEGLLWAILGCSKRSNIIG